MGQEEVSVIRKSFDDICNLLSNENHEKDIQISRKGLIMKTKGKKRMFALLMCVMMVVSSMSVWAAYDCKTIGSTPDEQAFCELLRESTYGKAYTTPNLPSISVTTAVAVAVSNGDIYSNDGTTSAIRYATNVVAATSTHQAGIYYGTIYL